MKPRILAAGALLWRDETHREICLVHRHRYDDWCLPKGKLGKRERFLAAVARETEEETGYPVRVGAFAGELFYEVKDVPKTVLFWHCYPIAEEPVGVPDPDEVEAVAWLRREEALARLTYADERALVQAAAGGSDS